MGEQLLIGSRGRNAGLILPPPLSLVRSASIPSSYSTTPPMVPGQSPPVLPTPGFPVNCGEVLRLNVTPYQKPAVMGLPPVTSEVKPGNESDGLVVALLVYVMP